MDNIAINSRHDDYYILISLDSDDTTMNTEDVKEKISRYPNAYPVYGHSKNKIDAINRDMDYAPEDWDILINMSDDMLFTYPGYDKKVINAMDTFYPDTDGVLHFPDQYQWDNCMTLSIVGRKYYERDKFIYDPRFESLWCDIVAMETAKMRGKYMYIPDQIVYHRHPSLGLVEYDAQYKKTEDMAVRMRDYQMYLKCKSEYDPTNSLQVRGA
jgi:hypothetical protein